jgi:hypothetical protein
MKSNPRELDPPMAPLPPGAALEVVHSSVAAAGAAGLTVFDVPLGVAFGRASNSQDGHLARGLARPIRPQTDDAGRGVTH